MTEQDSQRTQLESLLKRRLFYTESFETYRTSSNLRGGNRGLYDYGPPDCALLSNIVDAWRKHFIIEEDMLELDCAAITPEVILKASGHVDKFASWMCKDPATGGYLRAHKLVQTVLEERLESGQSDLSDSSLQPNETDSVTYQEYQRILAKIDQYDGPELGELIKRHDIRNPNGNGRVQEPSLVSLMFRSAIGPNASSPVYLRPETAQGQILNFRKLLELRHGAVPFSSACVGKVFHNEISPRAGLLKVREFLAAEIEHFVDPDGDLSHERFDDVAGIRMPFLDRETQLCGQFTVSNLPVDVAVETGVVGSETLGYFLARTYLFLVKVGVDKNKLRFRRHLENEMPHYASDCWGVELLTSYGWIQCGGCNNRSAYDLVAHSKATGVPLVVREPRKRPLEITEWRASVKMDLAGPRFKGDIEKVEAALASLDQDTLRSLASELADKGAISVPTERLADGTASVKLSSDLCCIRKTIRVEHVREYTPDIIESAFGFGRILYGVIEHVHWHRQQDAARHVLSFPMHVAPTKVALAPLSNNPTLKPVVETLARRLKRLGIATNIDSSSVSIGRRYARNDEMGTPLAITVDFATLEDSSITLRERDSTSQVRASEDDIFHAVNSLVHGVETWDQVYRRMPSFTT